MNGILAALITAASGARRGLRVSILMTLALSGSASEAWAAHTIHVNPGAYTGRYSVPGYGFLSGPQTVELAEGPHLVDTGAGAFSSAFDNPYASYFEFTVNAAG